MTANEGDAREWPGLVEEARVSALTLDSTAFPDAATLRLPANLGRHTVTRTLGDADGNGAYEKLFTLGGRSFSIWSTDGTQVYDSGSDLERITAGAVPANFNASNNNSTFDDRSDNKGPEPEAVTVGEIGGRTYAFIGLERVGGIVMYDVTDPTHAVVRRLPEQSQLRGGDRRSRARGPDVHSRARKPERPADARGRERDQRNGDAVLDRFEVVRWAPAGRPAGALTCRFGATARPLGCARALLGRPGHGRRLHAALQRSSRPPISNARLPPADSRSHEIAAHCYSV